MEQVYNIVIHNHLVGTWWGRLHIRVIREGFSEEVTFELKPERQEGASARQSGERALQEEQSPRAKAPRQNKLGLPGEPRKPCGRMECGG